MTADAGGCIGAALEFANALVRRDDEAAYAMTTRDYQRRVPLATLRERFDAITPVEFGPITSVDVGMSMESWPDKQGGDVGWVYVTIGGDVYSEALIVVITVEDDAMKVREVEFGRP